MNNFGCGGSGVLARLDAGAVHGAVLRVRKLHEEQAVGPQLHPPQGRPRQQEGECGRGPQLHPLHQPHQLQDQERGGPPPQGERFVSAY